MTEFAIILAQNPQAIEECVTLFGHVGFSVSLALYSVISFVALFQFVTVMRFSGCKTWLMVVVHLLVFVLCIMRGLTMLVYYSLYQNVGDVTVAIIVTAPVMLHAWLFSLLISAWYSIVQADKQDSVVGNVFPKLVVGNIGIDVLFGVLFIAILLTKDKSTKTDLANVGGSVVATFCILLSVLFCTLGFKLNKLLGKSTAADYSRSQLASKAAKRLLKVGVVLALALGAESGLTLFSVIAPKLFNAHIFPLTFFYYSLDHVCVVTLLFLFYGKVQRLRPRLAKDENKGLASEKLKKAFDKAKGLNIVQEKFSSNAGSNAGKISKANLQKNQDQKDSKEQRAERRRLRL